MLANREESALIVEVKSSISLCTPTLTAKEWNAAQRHGDKYVLAVVDSYGRLGQTITYIHNPAVNIVPMVQPTNIYRLLRNDIATLYVGPKVLFGC